MNLTAVDWVIIVVCFTIITAGGIFVRKYMKSVADFIVAGLVKS